MAKFLTCYDYGNGGIWRFIVADSARQIVTQYPELMVVDSPPQWMTQKIINRIHELIINIEDHENEFLTALIAEREKT
ncbi:hypothetical protein E2K93_13755 [Thalassotalea sp. HSM 43]|uniref:hypothetical protein n=1 Tax=Thalassotalea sp. HSM 43 TaxID=2552945 RepID=UPI0010816424|nr:hypothetical protein [Thalassotalea sp. HSM 43]QBY05375.1 hypothetical protein E2K93_13755 [Thalassotalea sp. HSM 43]